MDKIQMVDPLGKKTAHWRRCVRWNRWIAPETCKGYPDAVSEMVQEEVENRMTKAAEELQAKYARGEG